MSQADFGRIIHLGKRRERAKEDIEKQKSKLEEEKRIMAADIAAKFTSDNGVTELSKSAPSTEGDTATAGGGLVSLEEAKRAQLAANSAPPIDLPKKPQKPAESRITQKRVLSFNAYDNDDEEEEMGGECTVAPPASKRKSGRLGMDPTVDTSFLPDHERELQIATRKRELESEWHELQEKEKSGEVGVAFCYWDGSSHRRDTKMKKGATIGQFLQRAIDMLRKEFTELRTVSTDSLMFVKEDLIIPHFYTFLDFIVTKAMGKTGPLWEFDAVGEIRVRQDAALDTGESHPAKVVLRSWYEKNKHIYPASRWEAFVPNKEYKRTIDDLSTI